MDTAGMEAFRSINLSYYRNANCCLLVYDITNEKSFIDCKEYFNEKIKENCPKGIPIILLGNKTDLEEKRKVPSEDGAKFALEYNYIFMETSCMKNTNVADAFETLIEITHREAIKQKNNDDQKITLSKGDDNKDGEKKKKKCCLSS